MIIFLAACARRARTFFVIWLARRTVKAGPDLHIGKNCRLWAPNCIEIGKSVYIGKDVSIECDSVIGNYVLIANRVGMVGRHDHDFRVLGVPVRLSPWLPGYDSGNFTNNSITIGDDVWIGYGSIILSGIIIGRGAVIAAGSVVTHSVLPYDIVGGNPARTIGRRFQSEVDIANHEAMIKSGRFRSSERGQKHWIVNPGNPT